MTLGSQTDSVTLVLDTARPPESVVDRVKIIESALDTLADPPTSVLEQELMYAVWFSQPHVVTNPDDTLVLPPELVYYDTIVWGFWNRVDSFFMSPDSSNWCEVAIDTIIDTIAIDTIVVGVDTTFTVTDADTTLNDFFVEETEIYDSYGNILIIIDTVEHYTTNCDSAIEEYEFRTYREKGWGNYVTTPYVHFPDTLKGLKFENGGFVAYNVSMDTTEVDPLSIDTIFSDPRTSKMYFIENNVTTEITDLDMNLTMPAVEVFPEYEIIIKDE
jgi:hypothetical protein